MKESKVKTVSYKSVKEMTYAMHEWDRKHPVLSYLKTNIYYPIYRLCDKIKMIPREVKWFVQRGIRGWADSDVWSVDWYICKIMPPMLKRLKKIKHGYPCDMTEKQWDSIISDMIYMFEIASKIQNYDAVFPSKKKETEAINAHRRKFRIKVLTQEEYSRYKKGWKLFQEYFYSLWD